MAPPIHMFIHMSVQMSIHFPIQKSLSTCLVSMAHAYPHVYPHVSFLMSIHTSIQHPGMSTHVIACSAVPLPWPEPQPRSRPRPSPIRHRHPPHPTAPPRPRHRPCPTVSCVHAHRALRRRYALRLVSRCPPVTPVCVRARECTHRGSGRRKVYCVLGVRGRAGWSMCRRPPSRCCAHPRRPSHQNKMS